MCILYKYFHLVGAEQSFRDEGHRSSSLTLRAPSPLDRLRFCGNSRLWVIPTAHCRFHEVLLALAVACGHREVSRCPKGGFVEGATSRSPSQCPGPTLWMLSLQSRDAAPPEPRDKQQEKL